MPEIKQELGFSAAKAIDTLAKLDSIMRSFKSAVSSSTKALGSFNAKADTTDGILKRLKTSASGAVTQMGRLNKASGATKLAATSVAATQAASSLDKLSRATSTTGKKTIATADKATESVKKWTISWETLGRVIATQVIVRALSSIRNALSDAVSGAVDFQRALAEISTIAPQLGALENIADLVRGVSDAFNVGLDDTTEAAYETISNQIASTREEIESFLISAAKFSKVTKTDMETSVNLLSGVLNAFGKTVAETDEVAAKFFKTIDLGRIRAEELAQGYGTVAPVAKKLGISMEELNSTLSVLTISGIQADKAFTQIRGIMQSFLKPTVDMKKAMKELGFATGEQVLQAYNLQDAMRAIIATSDGSAQAVAKFVPRIRGLTGGLALADDETEHFTKTTLEQKKALEGAYDRAYKIVIETDAEKITKELNQLKNFFTVEFGQSVLEASVKLAQAVGGAETLLKVFKAMAPVLPRVAAGLGIVAGVVALVGIKAAFAKVQLTAMHKSLLVFIAAQAAFAAGEFIAENIAEGWDDEFQAHRAVMKKELEARKKKISAEITLEKTKVKELTRILAQGLAKDQKQYFKLVDAVIKGNGDILSDVKSSTNSIIASRQKMVAALQRQVSSMGTNIVASEKRSTNLRNTLDDQLFKRKMKRDSDRLKIDKLTRKSTELATEANAKLAKATTEAERDSAQEEFARAKAFADQALSIADSTDSRTLEKKALNNLKSITEGLIDAEKRYQQNIAVSAKALQKRTLKEEKRVEKLKDKQKELLEAFKITDDEGRLLSREDRAKQLIKAQKALREFIDISGEPLDVAAMLNFTGVSAQLSAQLHDFQIERLTFSAGALFDANKQLNDAVSLRAIKTPEVGVLQALTGIEIEDARSQTEALDALETKYLDLLDTNNQLINQSAAIATAQEEVALALRVGKEEATGFGASLALVGAASDKFIGLETSVTKHADALVKAQTLAKRASEGVIPSFEKFAKVNNELVKTSADLPLVYKTAFGSINTAVSNSLNAVKLLLVEQQKLRDIKKQAGGIEPREIVSQLKQIQAVQNFFKAPEESAKSMATSTAATQTNVANTVNPAAQVAAWQTRMANDSERQAIATAATQNSLSSMAVMSGLGSKRSGELASGGRVGYFANGGRGTDTIPAMLSAGEHVTNARSSRRFFSQLQAMNAGQQPVFRNDGGDTYNTNVGDINVSGAGKPAVVAREVMKAIRREERRGSGR